MAAVLEEEMYAYTVGDTVELYERNYAKLLELIPLLRQLDLKCALTANYEHTLRAELLERGPYSVLLRLRYGVNDPIPWLRDMEMQVRLYHDARVAEVVAYQHHQHFRARYEIPNRGMLGRWEKRQVNVFLGEWLNHCLEAGFRLAVSSDVTSA